MDVQNRPPITRDRREPPEPRASHPSFARSAWRSLPSAWGGYFALALALLASVVATVALERSDEVQRYGPNLTTELLGIIITLVFVQRLLARDERARKLRASVGPLRKGRTALAEFLQGWSTLLKGAFDPRRTELPRSFEHLFASDYTADLASLDPQARSGEAEPWTRTGIRQLLDAQRRLREVIAVYGASLDPDYLEAIDELADDSFVELLEELASRNLSSREWRVAINQSRGYREGHFVRLVHAVSLHNRLSSEAARFRSRHLAPSARSLSLQLRADHDLAVPLQLGREWWSTAPLPGELRSY